MSIEWTGMAGESFPQLRDRKRSFTNPLIYTHIHEFQYFLCLRNSSNILFIRDYNNPFTTQFMRVKKRDFKKFFVKPLYILWEAVWLPNFYLIYYIIK